MKNNWQIKKLDEVCDIEYGTRVVNKRDGGSIYPVYGGGGATFFMDKYNREDCMVIARFAMSEKCTRFIKGKFFLNDSGLTVLPKNDKKIDKDFLNFQLIFLNDYIYSLARGAAQKNLDVPAFRVMEIMYPELISEQHRIVKILDETFEKIEKAKENTEKNLKNSKELFESYLNNIFASSCNDWCEKKISDVCDVSAGNSAPQKKELFVGGKYPFFRTSDVGRIHIGIISDSSDYLNDKGIKGLRLFNKGTILLPKSGASTFLNHRVVLGIDGYVSSHLATIKTDKNILNNNYLFYFLQRIKAQDLIQDHRYPSLNLPVIGGIKISYPSLSEQKSIVTRLDKLSVETKKLKSIYKQKLADLEELKKSILKKAFNGEL